MFIQLIVTIICAGRISLQCQTLATFPSNRTAGGASHSLFHTFCCSNLTSIDLWHIHIQTVWYYTIGPTGEFARRLFSRNRRCYHRSKLSLSELDLTEEEEYLPLRAVNSDENIRKITGRMYMWSFHTFHTFTHFSCYKCLRFLEPCRRNTSTSCNITQKEPYKGPCDWSPTHIQSREELLAGISAHVHTDVDTAKTVISIYGNRCMF